MRLRRITVAVALATAITVTAASTAAMAAAKTPAGTVKPFGKIPAAAGKIPITDGKVKPAGKIPAAVKPTPKVPAPKGGGVQGFGKVPNTTKAAGKVSGKPPKPAKAQFTANGTVTAVDAVAGTVTVKVKGGTKDVRQRIVTIAVPAGTRVRVNSRTATVADIAAGFQIEVTGTRSGSVYTATRVETRGKRVKPVPTTSPTPAPTPSETTPAPSPTDSPEPSPTDSPEPSDTPEPTRTPDA